MLRSSKTKGASKVFDYARRPRSRIRAMRKAVLCRRFPIIPAGRGRTLPVVPVLSIY